MKRTSRIFKVKTYATEIKSEIGGLGLYYTFGYETDFGAPRVFVFYDYTMKFKILLIDQAKAVLEYYTDEPIDIIQEKALLLKLFKKTQHDFR